MTDRLFALSGTQAHKLVVDKEVSCVEIAQSTIQRIEQTNPTLNSIIDEFAETALVSAKFEDKNISRGVIRPLAGVTFTFKDNVYIDGSILTHGGRKDISPYIGHQDSVLVSNIRNKGAQIVGRTNCSNSSLRWFTKNEEHGATLNPFDITKNPGGSSGGAAAAVSSGQCAVAHGSDYAGSIRYPAWSCGVYGFRPTMHTIPSYNFDYFCNTHSPKGYLLQSSATHGVLARTVSDIERAYEIMMKYGENDPEWIPTTVDLSPINRPLRILSYYDKNKTIDSTILENFNKCVSAISDIGHFVEDRPIGVFTSSNNLHKKLLFLSFKNSEKWYEYILDDESKIFFHNLLSILKQDDDKTDLFRLLNDRYFLMCMIFSLFKRYDLIITPVCYQKQYNISEDTISTDRLSEILDSLEPQISSSFLSLPGMSVPTVISQGMPDGVQILCAPFREQLLFQLARDLESYYAFNSLNHLKL